MYIRNCPSCNSIIEYCNEKNCISAEKLGNKCVKCRQPKKDKTKQCVICNSSYTGQGKTCSDGCRILKIQNTKSLKYGNPYYNNRAKSRETCIEKYGVDNVSKFEDIKKAVSDKGRHFSRIDVRGQNNPMYGKQHSAETKRIQRIRRIDALSSKHPMYPGYNPSACIAIDKFGKENGYNFQHAENGGEYFISELGYWVDGYDTDKNVVIEYDESHHFDRYGNLKSRDIARQMEIESYLQCKFLRLNEKNELYA
jgi:hypothetical protein